MAKKKSGEGAAGWTTNRAFWILLKPSTTWRFAVLAVPSCAIQVHSAISTFQQDSMGMFLVISIGSSGGCAP